MVTKNICSLQASADMHFDIKICNIMNFIILICLFMFTKYITELKYESGHWLLK